MDYGVEMNNTKNRYSEVNLLEKIDSTDIDLEMETESEVDLNEDDKRKLYVDKVDKSTSDLFRMIVEGELNLPIFSYEKFKIGAMFGFEAHFDAAWAYMARKKVDAVIVPTACTFFSEMRWEELLKTRAFTNNAYVLRVNRVGSHKAASGEQWSFYGDSMLISPFGEVVSRLGKNEEMMVAKLEKTELAQARHLWGFSQILHKRLG